MEQARIVFVVGFLEQDFQFAVHLFAVAGGALQAAIEFDAAVFGDAKKDDAVNRSLHQQIEFALVQPAVVERHVFRQGFAPAFHLAQKSLIHRQGAARLFIFNPVPQRPVPHGIAAEERLELVPFFDVIGIAVIAQTAFAGGVVFVRPNAAVVDDELLKIA